MLKVAYCYGKQIIVKWQAITLEKRPPHCQSATKTKLKTPERLYTGETGRKRLRDVAELDDVDDEDDVVNKRLKSIRSDFEFKYHNTYSCYKKYTDTRQFRLLKFNYDTDIAAELKKEEDASDHKQSTRSSTTPRPAPNMPLIDLHSDYQECVICGNDTAWEKSKGKQVREKLRLCACESSNKFLNAINFHKDAILNRLRTLSNMF